MMANNTLIGILVFHVCLSSVNADEKSKPLSPDHAKKMQAGLDVFKQHVRPLLTKQCLECHGGARTRGKFDLSTRKALVESGHLGKESKSSQFFKVIAHQEEPFMPKSKPKLSDKDIGHIAKWIDLGAPYDKPLVETTAQKTPAKSRVTESERNFWSFRPLKVHPAPKVENANWIRTPIDRFILAKLEAKKLQPNAIADRRILIRRAYFDLIGLPPTPQEIDDFVNDKSPNAWDKVIDHLLQSQHYGERWARHWMDVARFAESHGYEQDYDRPHAYPYRDFLIRALNADMPYDQFVQWQIAGDELAPTNPLAMTATGFLGAGAFPTQLTEAEFERARYDELDDMVATTGVTFLGLSVGCARCHDHKFDPISAHEYYEMASIFTTTIRSEIDLQLPGQAKKTKVQVTSEGFPHTKHHADGRGFPHFYPKTHQLNRGDVHQKKEIAKPGYLEVLMRSDKQPEAWKVNPPADWKRTSFRRAGLANWLTDVDHGAGHLAARVIVNRLWQHHLGRGIVATPNDFGIQGEKPTHPELLDWLAVDLVHNGWKLKRLHKLIMTSAVYMQSTQFSEANAKIDRENFYLWRRTPKRLEAEAIRDAMLSVSGLLDKQMYGKGSLNRNMNRRSIYFFIKRSKLIPMMMLFDWPEHLVSIGRRSQTTIAPQALMFLNSPQARRYAEGFAKQLPSENAIEQAYRMALGRSPTQQEQTAIQAFLKQQTERHQKAGKKNASQLAMIDLCQTLMSTNEFIYVE